MLLAGGQGSRLYVLTENMAKPAVPFGGKFRIIDFPLSNCANAGIDTVGVLTQYRPLELNRYIGSGQPWDLDRADGGVHILPPYQSAGGASWYKGTANAIFQNIGFVDMYDPEYVLILSGDHIYKMNYAKMLAHHKKAGADCTISVMEVPWEDAPRFGIMNVDENDTITEFEEKPAHPRSNLASMGIYVFTWKKLREYLIEDESDEASSNDFGKNIIPKMLKNGEKMAAYRFSGYWKDVGTLDSLWDANMDMLATGSGLDLLEKDWPIYGRSVSAPPAYLGVNAHVEHSVVARGCTVEGEAENSVLSERCTVEEGASVQYSILMPGAVVKKDARVSYAIIGENGSGKSTLAKMLSGMIEPTAGDIVIDDKQLHYGDFRYRSQRIRMIFQDPSTSLNPRQRIGQILDVPLRLNTELDAPEREQRINETLRQVGLRSDHAYYYPHMLASGQIQRIALARALILQPQVIVADEALASLDMSMRSQIINLMLELQQKQGIAYIYVTQHLGMMKHISDQVMVMHHGEVVERGSTSEVLAAPLHEQTKRLINSHFGEALTADAWRRDGGVF